MNPRTFEPGPLAEVDYRAEEDRWTLVFVRDLRHPPERVWAALTDPTQLREWSPFIADRDLASTGEATLTMIDTDTSEDLPAVVRIAEPVSLLEYTWGTDVLRWELAAAGSGTRLTLRHTIADRDWLPKIAAGWHLCLLVAEHLLDGRPVGPIRGASARDYGWDELNEAYARRLGIGGAPLGTLSATDDGRFALRFERRLAHPQPKVWRTITESDQLRAWFVEILDYDRSQLDFTEGAKLTFVPKAEHELPTGHGEVTRINPPLLLEYTWEGETLRWELEADGDAGCRLVFTNIFDDREAAAAAPGWHAGLDGLGAHLDGRATDRSARRHLDEAYSRVLG